MKTERILFSLIILAAFVLTMSRIETLYNQIAKVSSESVDTLYVIIKAEESYEEITGLDANVTKRPEFNWLRLPEDSTDGVSGARPAVYRIE